MDYEELHQAFGGGCGTGGTSSTASGTRARRAGRAAARAAGARAACPLRLACACLPMRLPAAPPAVPSPAGHPPAKGLAQAQVAALPAVQLSEEAIGGLHSATCCVCLDAFQPGETARHASGEGQAVQRAWHGMDSGVERGKSACWAVVLRQLNRLCDLVWVGWPRPLAAVFLIPLLVCPPARLLCRVLPACTHAFHAACLDPWLLSKAVCPVCRAAVEAPPPEAPAGEHAPQAAGAAAGQAPPAPASLAAGGAGAGR